MPRTASYTSYTPARLATLQRDIDRTIARYLRELERQDQAEEGTEGPTAAALQEKIAALQQRRPTSQTSKDLHPVWKLVQPPPPPPPPPPLSA